VWLVVLGEKAEPDDNNFELDCYLPTDQQKTLPYNFGTILKKWPMYQEISHSTLVDKA
jgi:hypothetical protein